MLRRPLHDNLVRRSNGALETGWTDHTIILVENPMAATSSWKEKGVRRSGRIHKALRKNLQAYLFVAPWILSLLIFTAYPILASFYFALTTYTVLNPPQWVGLENFSVMFRTDPLYWKSVWNTTYYSFLSVPLGQIVALGLALLLNSRSRGIGVYRTIFYLPGLMPAVATALLWYIILDPRLGLLNAGLRALGLPPLGWLTSATWSKPALILIFLWSGTGVPMLIYLAGLKEIPQSLLEAATIDGANMVGRFWYITLRLLTPTIFFNLIIGIINSFQVFTVAFVSSSPGGSQSVGPLNSLLMYMIHLYRNGFRYFNMGYASAMAVVMFVVLVLITLALVRSANLWVHYEAAGRH
jgi:multiple sugar transport system permease protein